MKGLSLDLGRKIMSKQLLFSDRFLLSRSNTNRLETSIVPWAVKLFSSTVRGKDRWKVGGGGRMSGGCFFFSTLVSTAPTGC